MGMVNREWLVVVLGRRIESFAFACTQLLSNLVEGRRGVVGLWPPEASGQLCLVNHAQLTATRL